MAREGEETKRNAKGSRRDGFEEMLCASNQYVNAGYRRTAMYDQSASEYISPSPSRHGQNGESPSLCFPCLYLLGFLLQSAVFLGMFACHQESAGLLFSLSSRAPVDLHVSQTTSVCTSSTSAWLLGGLLDGFAQCTHPNRRFPAGRWPTDPEVIVVALFHRTGSEGLDLEAQLP